MKCFLLLPDFAQSGEISVWGDNMSLPVSVSMCEDIPLRELPDCFVLGIPESLLRANDEQNFIYAQYARLNSKRSALSFSIRGGSDKSGRTVVLTILQLLDRGESLKFPPNEPPSLPDSIDEKAIIDNRIEAMMRSLRSGPSSNIKDMILAVDKYPRIRSFASERSISLAKSPQWMPGKKKGRKFMAGGFIAFILLIILIIVL